MRNLACTIALLLTMVSVSDVEEIYLKEKAEIAMALKVNHSLEKVSGNISSLVILDVR